MTQGVYTTPIDDADSSLPDTILGTELQTDRNRPPQGSFVFGPAYDGTVFIIDDNKLYYSKPKRPEEFPALYYIEVGPPQFPGVTGVFFNGQPYYFTKRDLWYIQGTGVGVFQPIPTRAKTGAQSVRGAVAIDGEGIYHTGPDGIYLFSNGSDRKVSEDAFERTFRGETVNGVPGVERMDNSWLAYHENSLYFGYEAVGSAGPANILVLNLETGQVVYWTLNDGAEVPITAVTQDDTNQRLLIGDTNGWIRVLGSGTTDSGTAIPWEIESKEYTLQTRKHFPRWVKYDIDASGATTCTGELVLDGTVHHSHTITGSRATRRRLVGTGNGDKVSIRISGTGPATVYGAETE